MDALEEAWAEFQQRRPQAARLAVLTCLPVRVTPALVRLARLTLLPEAGTDTEADLWLSDLVEARSSAGFVYQRAVRELLRRHLGAEPGLLDAVWRQVHLVQAQWLLPRIRLEEELTWRILRNPADEEIDVRWREVVSDLDHIPNAEGLARWIVRAVSDLPEGALASKAGWRAYVGARILLGDASVLGDQVQHFHDTDQFAFATRRLARRTVFVGLSEQGLLVDPVHPIRNGHAVELPATRPLWLQIERIGSTAAPVVLVFDGDRPVRRETGGASVRLRLLDGSAYELRPQVSTGPAADAPGAYPRVELNYDVTVDGEARQETLPFDMWVLGDFHGARIQPANQIRSIPVRKGDIGTLMREFGPYLNLGQVAEGISVDGLPFTSIDDFSPAAVLRNAPALRSLSDLHDHVAFLEKGVAKSEALRRYIAEVLKTRHLLKEYARYAGDSGLRGIRYQKHVLSDILATFRSGPDPEEDRPYYEAIVALADHLVSRPNIASNKDGYSLRAVARALRARISRLLQGVIGHPEFKRLEASWLGLEHLVTQAPTGRGLNIRVTTITKKQLLAASSSDSTSDPAHSHLFTLLGINSDSAVPLFGCIVGDFYFEETAEDLALLNNMASLCAAALRPFIAATPYAAGLSRADEYASNPPTGKMAGRPAGGQTWHGLRARPESRYIVLTTPRFLARRPARIRFEADSESTDTEESKDKLSRVWANAAYLLALNISRSFHRHGWFGKLAGLGADTEISGLPFNDPGGSTRGMTRGVSEESIGSREADRLSQLGFVALLQQRYPGTVAFSDPVSIRDTHRIGRDAVLGSTLPYLFVLCGFAHCVQRMVESRFFWGSPDLLDATVNGWLASYVSEGTNLSEEARARYPLGQAQFRTEKIDGKVPTYQGTLSVLPRFQLHELSQPVSIQIAIPRNKFA